jgi:acyl-CoA synthetase (AMP-forming)/AMP-acid ligase II
MVFPFTHIGGIGWLFAAMMTGCRAIIVEAFDPATTIPVLQREGVTLAGAGTPFHMAYLAAQRQHPDQPLFPDARAYPGGGAAKPTQLHYDVKKELGGVGVVSGWGLTETPILTMCSVRDPDDKLARTEGRPTPGVTLKVVRLDGTRAKPGEEGELRAKGPMQCKGYLDESLNADALDEEGFFRTGDLGTQDAEGYVTITGRLKDVIIRKGENIAAKEVEDVLHEFRGVAEVAVIGLPDAALGERCCAVIVAREGADPFGLADIAAFCRARGMAVQKTPEQLALVDELPRNASGKVLKYKLQERFA